MLTLSQDERDRFATYLEEQAKTNKELAVQAKKLGAAGEVIAKRSNVEAMAEEIVARKLRSIETIA